MTVTQNSYPVIPNTTLILAQVLSKTSLIWIQMTPKRMALLNIHMRYYLLQTTTSNK